MLALLTLVAQAQPLVAVVVIDQEARDEGYALQLDGWLVEDALPVDVEAGEEVALVDPDGRVEPLGVAVGEAWEVTGPRGEAWMSRLGDDVRTDMIAVRGDTRGIERLADELGADVVHRGGVTYLTGPELLFDVPWASRVERIDEVRYVRADDLVEVRDAPTRPRVPRRAAVAAAPIAIPAPVAAPAPRAAPAVVAARVVPPAPVTTATTAAREAEDRLEVVRERYAGTYLCRDVVLALHASGVYQVAGDQGSWTVGAPGVIRMYGPNGELWYRAAFDEARHCRDVWTPVGATLDGPARKRR